MVRSQKSKFALRPLTRHFNTHIIISSLNYYYTYYTLLYVTCLGSTVKKLRLYLIAYIVMDWILLLIDISIHWISFYHIIQMKIYDVVVIYAVHDQVSLIFFLLLIKSYKCIRYTIYFTCNTKFSGYSQKWCHIFYWNKYW